MSMVDLMVGFGRNFHKKGPRGGGMPPGQKKIQGLEGRRHPFGHKGPGIQGFFEDSCAHVQPG